MRAIAFATDGLTRAIVTTKPLKTVQEHPDTALRFLEDSDREFLAGDYLQGSEKLWGAASQAVIALTKKRGWPNSKHSHLASAVAELVKETGDTEFEAGFGMAEMFHANFYHDFMSEDRIARLGPVVHRFVNQVLETVGDPPGDDAGA